MDKWARHVDIRPDLGKTTWKTATAAWMTRARAVDVPGVCVDWHILDPADTASAWGDVDNPSTSRPPQDPRRGAELRPYPHTPQPYGKDGFLFLSKE